MTTREPVHEMFIRAMSRPETFLVGSFAGLIVAGAILLVLPVSHGARQVGPLEALFTSTSAVCVTGLIVLDTPNDFSRFGQVVIMLLIQFGGLGIMTFTAMLLQVAGRKISFRSQAMLQDTFYQRSAAAKFSHNLKYIIGLTLGLEALGAWLLYLFDTRDVPRGELVFNSVFHAISAFCNAGFSLFSDSLISIRGNVGFMCVISALIILGGLGYTVLFEGLGRFGRRVLRRRNPIAWTLNSRVVLRTSFALIIAGAALLMLIGVGRLHWGGPLSYMGNALFQSITSRTAGFNSVDVAAMPVPALLWIIALMFVGGSPGSCAGGVKTTSLAVWVARLRARLQQQDDVTIFNRRLPVDLVRRTGLLVATAGAFNMLGVMILALTEMNVARPRCLLQDLVFEQVSAFATVGLSTGITPSLSPLGQLWIIVTMFIGRLGPLTVALTFMERKTHAVRLPEERLMIG